MKIYCDMDGVLADFDTGWYHATGVRLTPRDYRRDIGEDEWAAAKAARPFFFRDLPLMPDAMELWEYIRRHDPIILTGVPPEVDVASNQKVEWSEDHFGKDTPIICCRSRNKFHYCRPGDVIIDDWGKHRAKWESVGGIWILHTSAASSIEQLKEMGL